MDSEKYIPPSDWLPPPSTRLPPRKKSFTRAEKREMLLGGISLLVMGAGAIWFVIAMIDSPTFRWTVIVIAVLIALFGGLTWMIRVVLSFLSALFGGRL